MERLREIPVQVRLPASVAIEVVLQGIRIRLGRSLVTITGVVCGIAFLMSILTGQVIRGGVEEEERVRTELGRMESFLAADVGGLQERGVRLLPLGPMDEVEIRFLVRQARRQDIRYRVPTVLSDRVPPPLAGVVDLDPGAAVIQDRDVIFLAGERVEGLVEVLEVEGLDAGQVTISSTHASMSSEVLAGLPFVQLAREWSEEDLAEQRREARKDRFRSIWIVVISLLVTVIGIANAMLMSVTERFREIGTMKCLGALSAFIRRIFLFESSLMGFVGGSLGAILGMLFSIVVYAFTYGWGLVGVAAWVQAPRLGSFLLGSLLAGIVLSVIAAIYPASVASRMVPADALRSNI